MILDIKVFTKMFEKVFLRNDTAQTEDNLLQFGKDWFGIFVGFRFANNSQGVILNLSDTFASDVVLFTNSIESKFGCLRTQSITTAEHILTTLCKNRQETPGGFFRFEA